VIRALPGELATQPGRIGRSSAARRPLTNLGRYPVPLIGAAVIVVWVAIAALSPLVVSSVAGQVDVTLRLKPPSADHLFGTDDLGRDVFSRVLLGSRVSLPAGVAVVFIGGVIGTVYGGIAAYAGGRLESSLMRGADVVLAFPPLILAMAIAAALGIGATNAVLAMTVVWWPQYARLSRGLVLTQRGREYVYAAHVIGCGPTRTLVRHIFPNALGALIVLLTLDVGNAIITFAGLSFLGLGVVPPTPEWGKMVADGRLLVSQWWVSSFPGLAIFTVVMGFNFLGDGIRDWLDPRDRHR
jgi:peptide/nickel transport system permease protein